MSHHVGFVLITNEGVKGRKYSVFMFSAPSCFAYYKIKTILACHTASCSSGCLLPQDPQPCARSTSGVCWAPTGTAADIVFLVLSASISMTKCVLGFKRTCFWILYFTLIWGECGAGFRENRLEREIQLASLEFRFLF